MSTSRIFVSVTSVVLLVACGSALEPGAGSSSRSSKLVAPPPLPPLPPLPPPPPLPPIPAICLGPVCAGGNLETLTLGPVAPPVLPTSPLSPVPVPPLPTPVPSICATPSVAMQVLVLSANGTEPSLQAIQQALGYHTIPFTTWVATQNAGMLTADQLSSGCSGNYQGVILATGDLVYSPDGGITFVSALTPAEWLALRSYEQAFKVRELSWYTLPSSDRGLNPPSAGLDTTATPIDATLTAAGQNVFSSINAANPVTITLAWTYLTTPSDSTVTPLLVDRAGHTLISTRTNTDGRETMAVTFDSNPFLVHDLVLQHGLVEWVTKGIYLGEFRAYTEAQSDDLFIDDDMFFGGVFRMSGTDFDAARAWQNAAKAKTGNPAFRIAWAFNGVGFLPRDALSVAAEANSGDFEWISHTWDHENLDAMDYASASSEFGQNIQLARDEGFQNFSPQNIVTPDVSGLNNAAVLQAAWDAGIRYTISDTSRAGWDNPAPNIGIYSKLVPGMLHIPRKPTNLFYNVSTPAEWTAEYNSFYASFWGRNLTYQEILDKESQNLLVYLLQGNIDPTMYHQPNTRAYDGTRTLLGDLLDTAFGKFRRCSTLPIVSPDQHVAGARIANTMARNAAGVRGTLTPGVSVSFTSPSSVEFAASGICTAASERYAGKCITNVKVAAGQTVTFLMP